MTKDKSPELEKVVESEDSGFKDMVVSYIGNKLNPDTDNVTVEMAVEVLAEEFPELLLALAEENFIRGYKQALVDLDSGKFPTQDRH
jgi:hypothetical protein